MKKPDFFIVGAPKCGTTALQSYLSMHPDIFMPKMKEIHHFADDLLLPGDIYLNEDTYLRLFQDAGPNKITGEASVFHLLSGNAANNIYRFRNDAKIIAMFRNPVDTMYSLHSQLVYNGNEPIEDFQKALEAEKYRREGLNVPERIRIPQKVWYRAVVQFSEQIVRYFEVFGRERVQVIIYDDFAGDTAGVYKKTLQFIGANPEFKPEFKVVNSNKRVQSRILRDILRDPPHVIRWIGRAAVPHSIRQKLAERLRRINTKHETRSPMDSEQRRRLQAELATEIEKLSKLLGRDLTHWITDSG